MRASERSAGAGLRGRAWGMALAAIGLLLFTWPFVRTPPLGLLDSYLHLLGAWTVIVLALWATSRALADRGGGDA